MLIEFQTFSFKKTFSFENIIYEMAAIFGLGLNVFMFDKTSHYTWTGSLVTVLSRRRFISEIQWNLYITTT